MNQSSKARDLFQLIDRDKFDALCVKWNVNKGVRTFSTWDHVRVWVMAYLMKLESTREIETVVGVARSTFSDANQRRSSGFYEDLFRLILSEIHQRSNARKLKRAIRTLLAIDSTGQSSSRCCDSGLHFLAEAEGRDHINSPESQNRSRGS